MRFELYTCSQGTHFGVAELAGTSLLPDVPSVGNSELVA